MGDELAQGGFGHGGPNNGAGHGDPARPSLPDVPEAEAFRALQASYRELETSIMLARATFARQHGLTYNGARDEYNVLGYDQTITTGQYRQEYRRGGIAGRIVDVMPDACWRGDPPMRLIDDEDPAHDTEFEKAWASLDKRLGVCPRLKRTDKLSRLSTFAVLLIGAGGDLSAELPRGNGPDGVLYFMPFSGGGGPETSTLSRASGTVAYDYGDCSIKEFETDSKNPRFGLPKTYQIKRAGLEPNQAREVHWSRVVHLAEGLLEDEVYGIPVLERVWNLLADLRKVTGGGAEAFWLRANQGLHLDIDKDMSMPEAASSIAALKEQAEDYKHQLTRWLRTRGVTAKPLGSDVANFAANADAIITQIAGSEAIPKRILTGSEMGELASSQDRENFKDQVDGRQTGHLGPNLVRQLADRLIAYGYLPAPKGGEYDVEWSQIQVMTEQEKADGAHKWAATNQVAGEPIFTDDEIREHWYGYAPLTDEQRQAITNRAAQRAKAQAEANAANAPDVPGEEDEPVDPEVEEELKAAAARAIAGDDDAELLEVLEDAIAAGAVEVVRAIAGEGGLR